MRALIAHKQRIGWRKHETYQPTSSTPRWTFAISVPDLTRVFSPGSTRAVRPTPIVCPRFKYLVRPFSAFFARPRFLPALLTDVHCFQSSSPVTKHTNIQIIVRNGSILRIDTARLGEEWMVCVKLLLFRKAIFRVAAIHIGWGFIRFSTVHRIVYWPTAEMAWRLNRKLRVTAPIIFIAIANVNWSMQWNRLHPVNAHMNCWKVRLLHIFILTFSAGDISKGMMYFGTIAWLFELNFR